MTLNYAAERRRIKGLYEHAIFEFPFPPSGTRCLADPRGSALGLGHAGAGLL